MSTYRLNVRRFLNRRNHHAGAYIIARVRDTSLSTERDRWSDVILDIADCGRVISLDFPLDTAAERSNSIEKARLLAGVLTRFAEALEAEAEVWASTQRERRKTNAREVAQ